MNNHCNEHIIGLNVIAKINSRLFYNTATQNRYISRNLTATILETTDTSSKDKITHRTPFLEHAAKMTLLRWPVYFRFVLRLLQYYTLVNDSWPLLLQGRQYLLHIVAKATNAATRFSRRWSIICSSLSSELWFWPLSYCDGIFVNSNQSLTSLSHGFHSIDYTIVWQERIIFS